jgi:hypothetical protein
MGENHKTLFNVSEDYIHQKHQLPKILQHQLEGGTNPLVYRLQPEGSYNSLNSPASTGRRLQPPFLAPSFLP